MLQVNHLYVRRSEQVATSRALPVPGLQIPLDAVTTESVPAFCDDSVLCPHLADLASHSKPQILVCTRASVAIHVVDPSLQKLHHRDKFAKQL